MLKEAAAEPTEKRRMMPETASELNREGVVDITVKVRP
jgi:hypothetical protein